MEQTDKINLLEMRSAEKADSERELTALRVQLTRAINANADPHSILHPLLYLSAEELRDAREAWLRDDLKRVRELCDLARGRYPEE